VFLGWWQLGEACGCCCHRVNLSQGEMWIEIMRLQPAMFRVLSHQDILECDLTHTLSHKKYVRWRKVCPCSWRDRFLLMKGPAADAMDAPQPWGLLCNPMMKMKMLIIFCPFPSNGARVEWYWQGENRSTRGKTCPSAILSTTNPTWTDPGSNPGPRGGRPATNRLSHGTPCGVIVSWTCGQLHAPVSLPPRKQPGACWTLA
jgi:hypothetical protein